MTPDPAPELWRRVEALFYEALERGADSRAAFLEQSCGGDARLRQEVEELLAHTDATLAGLRQPVDQALRQLVPSGQTIGPFRLIRLIGEGGMGAVYLAERADEEYRQKVAIKLMRAGLGRHSDMLRRFRAERQILADLSHPYIARLLHGGTTSDGAPYLVMEYVDGMPIDRYCVERDLSIDDRVRLFLKVCSAVDYAHLNRVIHRDLKPANILVTDGGEPKLLDFGIAKLLEPGSGEAPTNATGQMMTPEYASPEQVRGEPVTQVTDIFCLGMVLYEAIAGKHPFRRENATPIALGHLICEAQPELPSVAARNGSRPPSSAAAKWRAGLDQIVMKAMSKAPAERYATAAEFADDLRAYLEGAPPRARTGAGGAIGASRGNLWLAVAAVVIVLAGIAAVYLTLNRNAAAPFNAMQMSRMTTRGNVSDAAISADGRFLAYVVHDGGGQSIWLTQLAAHSELRMAAAEAGEHTALTFTPDSNYLYYLKQEAPSADERALYRLPILGGEPQRLLADGGRALAFAPDGKHLAFLRLDALQGEASLMVANTDGSGVRTLLVRRRPAYMGGRPAWSPDGNYVAIFAGDASFYTPQAFQLITVRVADGKERALTGKIWGYYGEIVWPSDGRSLIVDASAGLYDDFQIWQVAYPGGGARRVTNDLGSYRRLGITADGQTLVAVATDQSAGLWVAPAANPAQALLLTSPAVHGIGTMAWNAHGSVLYSLTDAGARNIWAADSQGRPARQLTSSSAEREELAMTPDQRYILYDLAGKVWRMDADGGRPQQLTHGPLDVHPCPSADSRWVIYAAFGDWSPVIGGQPTLWKVPIDGGTPVQVLRQESSMPSVSPDGKWIAYLSYPANDLRSGSNGLSIASIEGGPAVKTFAIPPQQVYWSPDGKSLLYHQMDRGVSNVWRQPVTGGRPAQVTAFAADEIFNLAVSANGDIAVTRGRSLSDVVLIRHFR